MSVRAQVTENWMCVFAIDLTRQHDWKLNVKLLLQTLLDLRCRARALVVKLITRESDYL
jgi:hypothetical protein